ncbi:hypothetical protein V1512DRAFT_132580 [Lipomyces arxii]|uniref:uncharacterized protein n=1 Tax=Lipomyces arxii TaxID=56418 RepID=UPI0034CDEE50
MDSLNQMNDFSRLKYETILRYLSKYQSDKDVDCYKYHSWAIATVRRLYLDKSYGLCIQFCQQRLEQQSKSLCCPRMTTAYQLSREFIATGVRDSNVPDYFKLCYMLYHAQSHAELGRNAVATTEAAHVLILLQSMIARIRDDQEYIAQFIPAKREALFEHVLHLLATVTKFIVLKTDAWIAKSYEATPSLEFYCGMTFDNVYEAAQSIYHTVTSDIQHAYILHDYVKCLFLGSFAVNLARSTQTRKLEHSAFFPRTSCITQITQYMDTNEIVSFWKARLYILSATACLFEQDFELALVKLGVVINSLNSIVTAIEEKNLLAGSRLSLVHDDYASVSEDDLKLDMFEILDYLILETDLRRQEISGEIVDIKHICSILATVRRAMEISKMQYCQQIMASVKSEG